ncbi:MAG: major tail protein [Dorea sp.]|nr:major tail protein [Dorea sp.]
MGTTAENKVEFGLRNAYYASITEGEGGSISYGTPVRIPGAVSLTIDPSGDLIRFKADDIDYYTNPNNQGYEGNLNLARVTDKFREDILGETLTEGGVLVENADAQTKRFALLFEFQGDKKAIRHVLYYCSANRPTEASQTKDGGDPNTTDLSIVASPRPDNSIVKAKTTPGVTDAIYNAWYTKVYESASEVAGA